MTEDTIRVFADAINYAARIGRRVGVTHDRDGVELPTGTTVDGSGNLWLANGDPLSTLEDARRQIDAKTDRLHAERRMLEAYEATYKATEDVAARIIVSSSMLDGISADCLDRMMHSEVADEPTDEELAVDAARTRRVSDCERKRRRAFWNGAALGAAFVLAVGLFIVSLINAYLVEAAR